MIDQRTLELVREKLGGDFHLVALFQKRLRELTRGLPPLVGGEHMDLWQIVVEEILQEKLQLATGEEAERMRREVEALPERTTATAAVQRRRHATTQAETAPEAPKERVSNME